MILLYTMKEVISRVHLTIEQYSDIFLRKLKKWASNHTHCCILDHNSEANYTYPTEKEFDLAIAVKARQVISVSKNSFQKLWEFHNNYSDWLFGFLSYELKNELEDLSSSNYSGFDIPSLYFFQPEYIFFIRNNKLEVATFENIDLSLLIHEIESIDLEEDVVFSPGEIIPRISHEQYIKAVLDLKHHIQVGDIYEVNFCQEFFSDNANIEGYDTYSKLQKKSATPFGCFFKYDSQYLLCASPERYIKKKGTFVLSQPIKGTAKRGIDQADDEKIKSLLALDEKERAENVMIVDLVRNDLSKTAEKGSVKVEELFGIYSFKQVHQMISSVVSQVNPEVPFTDVLSTTFPMGSMTGAPKLMAMKLIEKYESTKRQLYSGSVGYITPSGDFDFNVVIRSILYNRSSKFLSFSVGGAITTLCDPEAEYEESLLKAKAMFEVLKNDT